jgi:hypothetical protein
MSPGWRKEWNVGVRVKKADGPPGSLVAFISAIPLKIRVRDTEVQTGEVNFLCVHKKLRNKRLAPSLIKEVTRRINREGIWQGLYTGGTLLPTPVTTTRYYHRPINWQRLYQLGFSSLPPGTTPAAQGIRFHISNSTSLAGFREMRPEDAPRVRDLLDRYLARYEMAPRWDEAEFDHWIIDRTKDVKKKVVFAYVVEVSEKRRAPLLAVCVDCADLHSPPMAPSPTSSPSTASSRACSAKRTTCTPRTCTTTRPRPASARPSTRPSCARAWRPSRATCSCAPSSSRLTS